MMKWLNKLDWTDILLHVVGVLIFFVFFGATILTFAIASAFLFIREIVQDYNKGHRIPNIWPIRRSSQKDAEFIVPFFIAGVIVWLA
jgi:hypothetical protein